jgi:TPR repeat protein
LTFKSIDFLNSCRYYRGMIPLSARLAFQSGFFFKYLLIIRMYNRLAHIDKSHHLLLSLSLYWSDRSSPPSSSFADMDKKKKKSFDPSIKDCANCGTSGAKLTCGQCKAAHYCSKACQKQHWKNGHKGMCFAPEKRRPQPLAAEDGGKSVDECPICFEFLSEGTRCTLPCDHNFHFECVEGLRKHGVHQACPLCRADLPPGPKKIFEDATRLYFALLRKVKSGNASWQALSTSQQKDMAEVQVMVDSAAHQGYADAQNLLGYMYHEGAGVTQDDTEAARWNQKAADQGNAGAQRALGNTYYEGIGVAKNIEQAAYWTRKAADQGDIDAQYNLGVIYHDEGVLQDYKEAARWTRKAADQGIANAQHNLALMYAKGQGVQQNAKEVLRWTLKASQQGYVESQYNLGCMYRDGEGIPVNLKEAARWLRKAADQGDASAQFNLARMYRNGEGVAQDFKEALRWTQKAAELGDVGSQVNLAKYLRSGTKGAVRNSRKAVKWFRKAAEQGDPDAQGYLAEMYLDGEGVARDLKETIRWTRKAAHQGHCDSQFNLGVYYRKGTGVPQDLKEAARWFQKAAAQGDAQAQHSLQLLSLGVDPNATGRVQVPFPFPFSFPSCPPPNSF